MGTGGMERLTSRILQRSADAIVVVRLADAAILGVNEAFLAVTGHPRHEVTGRLSHHVLAAAGPSGVPMPLGAPGAIGSITDAPVGIWTHARVVRTDTCRPCGLSPAGRTMRCAPSAG